MGTGCGPSLLAIPRATVPAPHLTLDTQLAAPNLGPILTAKLAPHTDF